MNEYQQILYSTADRIARITLNAPERRNAISLVMRRELVDALKKAERDDEVSVVLIDGAGLSFCAGADLSASHVPEGGFISEKWFDKWTDQMSRGAIKDWLTIWELLKPVVCKVHGHCLAFGTELMSMCDIVFAADDAKIGYPATRAQASPDTAYFPWKMTMARAKYLQMTGNWITGRTAAQWGWIAKSFPADQLETEVMKEVRALASIAPDQHASNKGCLNEAYEIMGFRSALAAGVHWHAASYAQVRPSAGEFRRIAAEKGMKEALLWRDGLFKETEGF